MKGIRVTVILHPWLTSQDERRMLVEHAASRLAPGESLDVLNITGHTHSAAVANCVASRVNRAADPAQRHLVLLHAGNEGETIAAQVAVLLEGVNLGRCAALDIASDDNAVIATRAAFGGRLSLRLRSAARFTCATLRPPGDEPPAAVQVPVTDIALHDAPAYPTRDEPAITGQPRVEGASIVVSGGRGMEGADGFEWLARIARALGAGLGGSLPAVDAGWVPVAHQVGQSGKFVAPRLYLAVGISGTPQHMAGVSPSARIVALNNDRSAGIFSRCDVGVEGDWREILPLLVQALERERASA